MFGSDEIIFSGAYKNFTLGVRYDLGGKQESQVAYALSEIGKNIEQSAYEFAGIDTKKLDGFALPPASGLEGICRFLESNSTGTISAELAASVKDPKLAVAAESYLLKRLLEKAGVAFRAESKDEIKSEKEKTGEQIAFIAKYRGWVSIKKLGIEKNTKDYEVSAILAAANHSAVHKSFEFAGVKDDDSLALKITKGKRKSYGNLKDSLLELKDSLPEGNEGAYAVLKTFEALGYRPYATPGLLTEAHPDIKPPKVKGRKPKG